VPTLSRRQILAAVPAGALVALAPPLRARADPAPAPDGILANTTAMFAGTEEANVRPEAADKLDSIHTTAGDRLDALDSAGAGELFAGLPLGEVESNLSNSCQYLFQIALATRTPAVDSDLVGDQDVQRRVLEAMEYLHDNYLADQDAGYYGNWYDWEIAIPTHASRTLALLADRAAADFPDLAQTYTDTLDAYLRNGKDGDVDLDSRFHTGANLADITTNRILQGAVLDDRDRISKAITDQATVFATIDPYNLQHGVTDGYYEDGSFIQHHTVAYTGSYGRTLLTRVLQTIKILDGTEDDSSDLADVVYDWVADGFAPVIFEGWLMECVKGRAVARPGTGYSDLGTVIEAIVDLVDRLGPDQAERLSQYLRFLVDAAATAPNVNAFVSPVSVVRYADIIGDETIPAADLNPEQACVAFNAMERTVHHRPGYAFALSRSSERISKYEYMNGENLLPWFSGDGAHHLYLAGQDQREHFGIDFLTTVSPYRLPGVIAPEEERQSVPEAYGEFYYDNPDHPLEFTASSESQNTYTYFPLSTNTYSGGATLGAYGAAGMVLADDVPWVDQQEGILPEDFLAYASARARRSWFMFDDEIVVLDADVHDPSGRDLVSTIDARIADPGDEVVITGAQDDGAPWDGESAQELAWLQWANHTAGAQVGYVFLDGPPVHVGVQEVTRSQQVVRVANSDTDVTKSVFTATFRHGPQDHAGYAYAIVPGASQDQLAAYREDRPTVIANNDRLQAVRHADLGLTAMNVFAEGEHTARLLTVEGPASVLMRESGNELTLAISDPTMLRESISVTVRGGRAMPVVDADSGVVVEQVSGGTRVTAQTLEAYGASFTVTLRRR